MGNPLLDRRTPAEWAASGQIIEFSEKIDVFDRLSRIVEGDLQRLDPDKLPPDWRDKIVAGKLRFGFSDAQGGSALLQGNATVIIDAVCQRCLQPLQVPLEAELKLLFGSEPAGSKTGAGFEVWELAADKLRPLDVVEEALVMAMPLAAMHVDDEACYGPDVEAGDEDERIRPFASLKMQMEETD